MPSVEAAERCVVVEGCDLWFVFIGERLREWREVRKLSECDLEQASGISRLQTARFEDGLAIPDIEPLRVYAHVLKIPVTLLLYGDDAPQANGIGRGLSEFAEMFSLLSRGEHELLRRIALIGRTNTQGPASDLRTDRVVKDAECAVPLWLSQRSYQV